MLVSMMDDIRETGCMGGLVFSWQDEWFKRTWNTKDQEESGAPPLLVQRGESRKTFGLLSFDPGESNVVTVDGSSVEMERAGQAACERIGFPLRQSDESIPLLSDPVRRFRV
jgi:hypothetical protein